MALSVDEPLTLRPDFWTAFLWKRTLGTAVLAAASSSPTVRAWAFAGAPPSPFAEREDCGALSLLLLNLENSSSTAVALPPPEAGGGAYAAWTLTAAGGDPFARGAELNGAALPLVVDQAHIDPSTFLQRIVQAPLRAPVAAGVLLPPLSTTFLCYA
jgi:hypothetical protein